MTLTAPTNITETTTSREDVLRERDATRARDRQIQHGLLNRRESALAEAYAIHGRRVFGVAYGILRRSDLAEDVTQNVFLRLWHRPERFDADRGSLGSFLQLDAHGRSVDLLRSERARSDRELRDHRLNVSSAAHTGTEEEVMREITSERVRDALRSLRPEQRAPIVLAFFQGYSYRQAAEVLGEPEGTVKSRIRMGMNRLKELLGTELPAFS